MKANIIKILWGIVMIAAGGLLLADRFGYADWDLLPRQAWSLTSAGLSVLFFACYFLAGVRKWGWLFPALVFAALALVLSVLFNARDELIAMPILLSVGIPFYVGYFVDRKQWGLLIPAWIMSVISPVLVFAGSANDNLVGATVLFAIAFPFLVVYLAKRQHKWALITGLALAFIGLFPLLGSVLEGELAGPVVMFLFTVFFLAIHFISKKAWWALIPAGVFASIGLVALLDTLFPSQVYFMFGGLQFHIYSSVLLFGFALTFGILWLLRGSQPTAWAKYPATGLLILSLLALLMWSTLSDLVPAIALLVIGVAMILASVIKRRSSGQLTVRNP